MKPSLCQLAAIAMIAVVGCRSSTEPVATLSLTTTADFTATVTKNVFVSGNGPAGYYEQNEVWVMVPPGVSANAGVVVAKRAPIYIRHSLDDITTATASSIRVGDVLEIWHDFTVGYGSVQAPVGSPVYTATQVVIDR